MSKTKTKSQKTKLFNIRLELPIITRIDERSRKERRTKTAVVVQAINEYLKTPVT